MSTAVSTNLAKHESGNRLLQRFIRKFHERICSWIGELDVQTVLDVGCGEGFVASDILTAHPKLDYFGVDLSADAVVEARERCPTARFEAAGVEDLPLAAAGQRDLVVCIEVLEHLPRPHDALATLAACSAKYALLTVPWEPWFILGNLARGKYLRHFGNHPEHVNHWSHRGFRRFASAQFEPVRTATSYPWTLFLGKKRW